MTRRLSFAAALAAGCAYQPASFHHPFQDFPGTRLTVGCLDIAVELAREPRADGPVLGYTIGNRCDRVALVDLGAIVVDGTTLAGRPARLVPYDPDRELRPLWLEVRSVAREQIEYREPGGDRLQHGVCAAVGDIAGVSAGGSDPRWLCFERPAAPGMIGAGTRGAS